MKTMFEVFKNRLEITGILETVTALRISAGRSTEPIGSDLPVIKDALGRPLIPGSSFKGALRSRLESFLRGIHESFAANPALETEWSITQEAMSRFKHEQVVTKDNPQQKEDKLHKFILDNTDLISYLFGSPWLSSKLQIRDLTVHEPENNWFGQYQERDGVAIDRDTETAGDGKLYDFQVVPAGTPFKFHAVVENADDWELGLLTIGLHQFEIEQIPLGGGKSRGLGVVRLTIDKNQITWVDVRQEKSKDATDPDKVISYMQSLLGVNNPENTNISTNKINENDWKNYKDSWVNAFIAHLHKKIEDLNKTVEVTNR
jgi:CRISPR-associated RAMP protein (TIGR02581 family)